MSNDINALAVSREYAAGIGQAVADRTVNRMIEVQFETPRRIDFELPRDDTSSLDAQIAAFVKSKGFLWDGDYHVTKGDDVIVAGTVAVTGEKRRETWAEVAKRVAHGNALLGGKLEYSTTFAAMHHHLKHATTLMSGRHLQHGDETQPTRPMEVFTNCSTAAASFLSFYLLLNGSGVGRAYDDALMLVDWNKMPIVVTAIDGIHKDVLSGEIIALDRRAAQHLYADRKKTVFEVPDSREGWAKAIAMIEYMAFRGSCRDEVLILDFSKVRPRGSAIKGMQKRPASGPGPLMAAINHIARIRDAGMKPWKATLYVDHYLAECVLVGGARRAARMATKTWRDPDVLEFIRIKRPIEFNDKTGEEIMEIRADKKPQGFLWSSNNSITTDMAFWNFVEDFFAIGCHNPHDRVGSRQAVAVFETATKCAYYDGTGEPGFINVDQLEWRSRDFLKYLLKPFVGDSRYKMSRDEHEFLREVARVVSKMEHPVTTNPCGEIVLSALGGYCVIGDVVPYHARDLNEAESAFRVTAKALMRTNMMESLYRPEVERTNRIGVSMTGIHEFALGHFGFGFLDLIDEVKSKPFWDALSRFRAAVVDEATEYAKKLGVEVPHTMLTIKPAGTTSKLFGLTEGAHLPAMREYLRWVQFRYDDPLIKDYEAQGYPVRELKTYSGTTIVGFPTQPEICRIAVEQGLEDKIITASEATPAQQYQWLRLLEKYWIKGVDANGEPLNDGYGNQVSYTLKYDPAVVGYKEFADMILTHQRTVRCCSVLPVADNSAFEYLPEEAVTKERYEQIAKLIDGDAKEDVDFVHVDCASGACPIDFDKAAA